MLDENSETFVTHMTSTMPISVQPDREAQIASLLTKKVKILDNSSDFVNIFSKKKVLVLPKRTKFNQYAIKLEEIK